MIGIRFTKSVVSMAALTLAVGLVTPVSANASDLGNETGGDVSLPTEVEPTDDDEQAMWRGRLDSAYLSYLEKGTSTSRDYLNKVLTSYTGKNFSWHYSADMLGAHTCPKPTGGGTSAPALGAKTTGAATTSAAPAAVPATTEPPPDPGGVDDETSVLAPASDGEPARGDGTTTTEATTDFVGRLGISGSGCSGPPRKMVLNLKAVYGQVNGYYCGPAAGQTILKYLGATRGKQKGARFNLSQGSLAASAYMATTKKGTPWASDRFRIGLNRWLSGSNTGYYISVKAPTYARFKGALVTDVVHSHPFGANAVEFGGGKHYNGHPDRTIGHWLTAYGYDKNGSVAYFADPSFTVFSKAKARFTASSKYFTETFLQSNGITY